MHAVSTNQITDILSFNDNANSIVELASEIAQPGIKFKRRNKRHNENCSSSWGFWVTKTIKNKTKEQKRGFLSMLLFTPGAILLGNLLSGEEIVRAGSENKKGKGIARAGYGSKMDF